MRIFSSALFGALLLPFVVADTVVETSGEAAPAVESPELKPLVARANVLLSAGQFSDAIKAYSDAIDLAPTDYVLYFKRATAYLSSNRHNPALDDFNTVLRLTNGSFDGAVIAKAKIYAKEGQWVEGREALKEYSKKVPGDRVAGDLLFAISEAEAATKKAATAQKAGKWDACIEATTTALQTATYSTTLRQQRADCALASGDLEQAVADLTRLTHLGSGASSIPLLLQISTLSYYLMEPSSQGLASVKQCLHSDPDSKPCKAAHKKIKALDKLFTKLEKAGDNSREVIRIVTTEKTGLAAEFENAMSEALANLEVPLPKTILPFQISVKRATIYRAACRAYIQINDIKKGDRWCRTLLDMNKDDMDALVGVAESALKAEEWDEAVRLFDRAFEASGRQSQDIHNRLQKAHRLAKQAKKKDYYKVLGVSRDADTKAIKKAYRKAAILAHPDKGGNEQKMASVNEAYEVLSNEELRARYDNGDDPNDPTSQYGPGGGHPFHGSPFQFFQQGGGHPFAGGHFGGAGGGGGGQQFKWSWST